MPEQCECAQLDWSEVIAEATRRGEPTPEHHPDCWRKDGPLAQAIEKDLRDTSRVVLDYDQWVGVEGSGHVIGADPGEAFHSTGNPRFDPTALEDELKANPLIYFDPEKLCVLPERLTPGQIMPPPDYLTDNTKWGLPPRTIEELTAAMEGMFEVGEPTDCGTAVTGEEYISLTSGGVREEGERHRVFCTDEEKAIELFYGEYQTLIISDHRLMLAGGFKLYWRQKPEMRERFLTEAVEEGISRVFLYVVTARLLISDKPPLEK